MIVLRRIWQGRAWSSGGPRLLHPYPPPSPAPIEAQGHPLLAVTASRMPYSGYASASSYLAKYPINFNTRYNRVVRLWLSSQALADPPLAAGIVDVPLAQTGEGIAECEIIKWFVQEGDQVEEFQPLCEVQSDKATIEITSRYRGKVAHVRYTPGDIVKVGETLLKMVVEDSQVPSQARDGVDNNELFGFDIANEKAFDSDENQNKVGGVLSTPAVRHLAKQHGINLIDIQGTGKDGRVLKEDVLRYAVEMGIVKDSSGIISADLGDQSLEQQKYQYMSAKPGLQQEDKKVPLRGFQRTMVKTMSMASKIPHFHYVEEIICDALIELKEAFQNNNNDPGVKYSFLPVLIKSLSMSLSKYPWMNSCFDEESVEVILKDSHNIGIAMATPYGLVVPNIKNVQSLSIFEITKELSRLQQSALHNQLNPEDITGGTITLSNIGAIGGKFGSPLVNLPEVAIIAIGRIQRVPHFADDGTIHPASVMTVNIGADHRVLDGAIVARFCNDWKQFIEKPELLMLLMR